MKSIIKHYPSPRSKYDRTALMIIAIYATSMAVTFAVIAWIYTILR